MRALGRLSRRSHRRRFRGNTSERWLESMRSRAEHEHGHAADDQKRW
jgi:hypothetical protein